MQGKADRLQVYQIAHLCLGSTPVGSYDPGDFMIFYFGQLSARSLGLCRMHLRTLPASVGSMWMENGLRLRANFFWSVPKVDKLSHKAFQ